MSAGTLDLPKGELDLGSEDLFVAHVDGGLWVHLGALGDAPGTPWQLADFEDLGARYLPYTEVTSPIRATWAGVAGDVDGVVYYSVRFDLDPSKDASGGLNGDFFELPTFFAVAAENADSIPFDVRLSTLALSLDHTRLATAGAVVDLATGSYETRATPCGTPQPMTPCLLVDMVWSLDGTSLVFLYVDNYYGLMSVDPRAPFETVVLGSLGVVPAASFDGPFDIHLAGRGPSGEIAVSVGDATGTVIRYYHAATLIEIPGMQRALPAGVTSVRLADDGVGLLWVDDTNLWYLPAGGDVHNLGLGYTEAWYAV